MIIVKIEQKTIPLYNFLKIENKWKNMIYSYYPIIFKGAGEYDNGKPNSWKCGTYDF